jgi:hypothetical protein
MWAETVDPSDLHNTVWPRAAAVAEVLWTPYEVVHPGGAGKFCASAGIAFPLLDTDTLILPL